MKVINRNGNIAICPGKGETLSMIGNKWYLNGKEVNINDYCQNSENNHITINIEGSLDRLEIDSCDRIIVHGDCKRIRTNCGDIECRNVEGDVRTNMGSIRYCK